MLKCSNNLIFSCLGFRIYLKYRLQISGQPAINHVNFLATGYKADAQVNNEPDQARNQALGKNPDKGFHIHYCGHHSLHAVNGQTGRDGITADFKS